MYALKQSCPHFSLPKLFHEKTASNLFRKSWTPTKHIVQLPLLSLPLTANFPLSSDDDHTELTKTELTKTNSKSAANLCPLTPLDFLDRAALVYGDCPSVVYNEISRTWSETRTRCLKLASSIASLGINKGDVVSVVAPNIPAMCELQFAVPMSGTILNNVNIRLDEHAISNIFQHAESKLIFVDYQFVPLVLKAISLFPSNVKAPALVLIREDNDVIVEESTGNHVIVNYEDMVKSGDSNFKWIRPVNEWEPITLNYTSGTTNSPKGVLHSHRGAYLVSLDGLLHWSMPFQPVYLWTLPIFHANGWSYGWSIAAVGGTSVCLRRVDAPSVYEAFDKYNVTHMCGAPIVLNMLTNHPTLSQSPLKNPVHMIACGAPPPLAVIARAEAMGFIISHGYGLTETGAPVVTCAWKKQWDALPDMERAKLKVRQGVRTVGLIDVDVVDFDSGESVPRDGLTLGEIVLKGPSLMLGYLKDPIGTSRSLRENGWLYTGDVGVMHPDGYIELKDRSKDIIIRGGENLSSVEVESVLYSHPAVNEAAVVAQPDTFWGETPCAFVSLKDHVDVKPTEKEIREFCKHKLPLYMVPRTVVFKDELPKTSTGKIQKFLLRDLARDLSSSETTIKVHDNL